MLLIEYYITTVYEYPYKIPRTKIENIKFISAVILPEIMANNPYPAL